MCMLMALLMAFLMALLMSAVQAVVNPGLAPAFQAKWMCAVGIARRCALPAVILLAPVS